MTKKLMKSLAIAAVGSLLAAGSASALSISLDDGNDGIVEFTATDGGANDANSVAGMVQFNASVGSWLSNVTIGTSYPALGSATRPMLDLFSLTLSSATGGTIAVSATDTYAQFGQLDASITGFVASIGGTTGGSVDFLANINGVDIEIGWNDMLRTGGAFAGSESFALSDYVFTDNDTWDMTLTAIVTQGAGPITTLDASAAPVPEPATMLLLGTGLVGLAGVRRRKKSTEVTKDG